MRNLFSNKANHSQGVEQKKIAQKMQILKALYFNDSLSNAELATMLSLSTPKIYSLLLELIDDHLVIDHGPGIQVGADHQIFMDWLKMDFTL